MTITWCTCLLYMIREPCRLCIHDIATNMLGFEPLYNRQFTCHIAARPTAAATITVARTSPSVPISVTCSRYC